MSTVIDLREWKIANTEAQPATAPAVVDASHEDDMRVLRERCQLREEEKRTRREEKRRLRERRREEEMRGDEDLRTLVERARRQRRGEEMRPCFCPNCLSLAAPPARRTRGRR